MNDFEIETKARLLSNNILITAILQSLVSSGILNRDALSELLDGAFVASASEHAISGPDAEIGSRALEISQQIVRSLPQRR